MKQTHTAAICDWIRQANQTAVGSGVLAFDADGTLWSGDVAEDFIHDAIGACWFKKDALDALRIELHGLGLSQDGDSNACMERLFGAYVAGAYPSHSMCEAIGWVAAGYTIVEAQARAQAALVRRGLGERVRPEMRALFSFAHAESIPIYVVSASPSYVVRAGLAVAGLDCTEVIGVEAEVDEAGTLLPRPVLPIPHGPGKVSGLRAKVGDAAIFAAFGDNWLDAALLRESQLPVAVYPKPKLLDIAHEVPGLRLLAEA